MAGSIVGRVAGAVFRFVLWCSFATLIASIGIYFGAEYFFALEHVTCFGTFSRRGTKPFVEMQLNKEVAYVFDSSTLVFEETTPYQTLQVYTHGYFGNILVIDGSLQITQRDEVNYHEMMVHVPMAYLDQARRAIIIGGGDGGALTRVLQYPTVEEVFLIDIDMRAVRDVTQRYFPALYNGYLDPRTKAFSYDGNQWVAEQVADRSQHGQFDLIIVDSTDYGSAESLFTEEFYGRLSQLLNTRRGVLLINLDSPSWNLDIVAAVQRQLALKFRHAHVYQAHQPSFLSGHYSYLFCSDNVDPMRTPIDWAAWDKARLVTYYYSPELHFGSFLVPEAVRRQLSVSAQLSTVPPGNFYPSALQQDVWPQVDVPEARLPGRAGMATDDEGGESADSEGEL